MRPELMEIAARIVAELELDHFFNIQLVGEHVIEINPRISTIVYQEDLNLPWLGRKHALGELSDEEAADGGEPGPPGPGGAALFRPGRVGHVAPSRQALNRRVAWGGARGPIPSPHPPTGRSEGSRPRAPRCDGSVPSW